MRESLVSFFSLLFLQLSWFPGAWGEQVPVPLRDVRLRAAVAKSGSTFTYKYLVMNPAINRSQIFKIDIDITRVAGQTQLSRDQLVNGACYAPHISQRTLQRVPLIPVGIDGPAGWICALAPAGAPSSGGLASWGAEEQASLILPDQAMDGFVLTSPGLPGIRSATINPEIDYDSLPVEFDDPDKMSALLDSLTFRTSSVGPTAPPAAPIPLDFLDYLIELVNDSGNIGWIRVGGVRQSLLAKLDDVRRKVLAGQPTPATNVLKAFLNEVQATSCLGFTCPGNKPLTSEAYALLFFNGNFLLGLLAR